MNKAFFILFFITICSLGFAQPKPCGPMPAMTSFCKEACIICDIDGFEGINNSNVQGEAPPGFCTSQVHHMQWLAFIAGTTDLTIKLEVYNCKQNNGLEVGIYETLDCENFRLMTECDTDIEENSARIFKNIKPLTVGQYYYWVMDGSANDVCNYKITVLDGSTKVDPLTEKSKIILPPLICQDKEIELTTPGLTGATIYDWTIDDKIVASTTTTKYKFDVAGKHTICLDARNVCDKAPQNCMIVDVAPTPTTTIKQEICFGECYAYNGSQYCETKTYPIKFARENKCDSIVFLDIKIDDEIVVSQSARVCEGDVFTLGDGNFTTPGSHIAYITNADGCKVKVNLNLEHIKCNIKSAAVANPITCFDDFDGSIGLQVTYGTGPFTYTWFRVENKSINGAGSIDAENDVILITNLDEGEYLFEIKDNFGNVSYTQARIVQPKPLTLMSVLSLYNGYSVPCHGDEKGMATLEVQGGNGNYIFDWSHGKTTLQVENLAAGIYTVKVSDAKSCSISDSVLITEPPALDLVARIKKLDCEGINTGALDLTNSIGGVKPHTYRINDGAYTETGAWLNLTADTYLLALQDINGCKIDTAITLTSLQIPDLRYDSIVTLDLGDSTLINILSNLSDQEVKWTPAQYVDCTTCLTSEIDPVNTTDYTVVVTSVDGCSREAVIRVNVIKNYIFEIANIYTPNADGREDLIRYYGNKAVKSILNFDVYDRWGNKLFKATDLPAGLNDLLWDATFNGRQVEQGVYVWQAKILYLDNVVKTFSGSVTVLR